MRAISSRRRGSESNREQRQHWHVFNLRSPFAQITHRVMATLGCLWILCGLDLARATAHGAEVTMRDGRKIEGKILRVREIAAVPDPAGNDGKPVVFIDDDLRYMFVPFRQTDAVNEGAGEALERFE